MRIPSAKCPPAGRGPLASRTSSGTQLLQILGETVGFHENSRKSIGFGALPEIWRGVSEISGGFWKQNHEGPAWRELAGSIWAARKLPARPGRPRDLRTPLPSEN